MTSQLCYFFGFNPETQNNWYTKPFTCFRFVSTEFWRVLKFTLIIIHCHCVCSSFLVVLLHLKMPNLKNVSVFSSFLANWNIYISKYFVAILSPKKHQIMILSQKEKVFWSLSDPSCFFCRWCCAESEFIAPRRFFVVRWSLLNNSISTLS